MDTNVVYYVAWADRANVVKIGTTIDIKERLTALRWQMNRPCRRDGVYGDPILLGTERGDTRVEKQRHRQFQHLRVGQQREFFHRASELDDHISSIR